MLFLVWSSFLKIKLNFLVNAFINLSILIISEGKEKSLESPIILQNTNFLSKSENWKCWCISGWRLPPRSSKHLPDGPSYRRYLLRGTGTVFGNRIHFQQSSSGQGQLFRGYRVSVCRRVEAPGLHPDTW